MSGKKVVALCLLLVLAGSVFVPLDITVSFSPETKTLIVTLDVCHSQGSALAEDGDGLTVCECACTLEAAESCALLESTDFSPDRATFARPADPPPRY